MSGKYSFVALDLDGTLLNSHHELSQRSIDILRKLSGLGVTIAIATGRSAKNLIKYIHQLDLPQASVPVVCYNGAVAMNFVKKETEYETTKILDEPLSQELTRKLLKFASLHQCVVQYYNGNTGDVYAVPVTEEHRDLLKRYEALVGCPQVILNNYEEALSACLSAKLLIMTDDADGLIASAKEHLPVDQLTIIRGSPFPFFVEFLKDGVTKGHTLVELCQHLGMNREHVVAFGDGDNDQEMLQFAGFGCAMKNAKDAAKVTANVVIEWSNDDDGVAQQLEKMLENGEFYLPSI